MLNFFLKSIFKFIKYFKLTYILNFTFSKVISGRKIQIPHIYGTGFEHLYKNEPWMMEVFEFLKRENVSNIFYDFGANSGQTLLKYFSVFGDKGSYFGFEPNPYCVSYLNTLISKNDINNAIVYPVAISGFNGITRLHFFADNLSDSSASVITGFRENVKRRMYVSTLRLQNCCPDIPKPDIVKIDVEGGELVILEELNQGFLKNTPIILLEILPIYDEANQIRLENAKNILSWGKKHDYSLYQIVKQNNKVKDLVLQTKIMVHSDLSLCDYLFIPNEKSSYFSSFIKT